MSESSLDEIFGELKALLQPYLDSCIAKVDTPTRYNLESPKTLFILNKERKGFAFVALMIQSKSVVLYYMPLYIDPVI